MHPDQKREDNQAAYRRLNDTINQTYPKGRYVAIDEGQIVGDAATFDELDQLLDSLGKTAPDVLVIQAGVDYPDKAVIFLASARI